MTRKAVVIGEFHVSSRAAKDLFAKATSTTDALFLEGRSNTIQLDESSVGYVLFLIGYLSLELIYKTNSWVRRVLPISEFDIREEAKSRGIAVEDEIDAELHEVWHRAEGPMRKVLYYVCMLAGIFAITNPILGTSVYGIPKGFISVLVAWGIPILFSGMIVYSLAGRDGYRDEMMSDSIVEVAEEEDYEEILVLCGSFHVEGISERLQDEGWVVEQG